MKRHFYSIWFKIVLAFFWIMVITCVTIGFTVHLVNRLNLWRYLSFPLTSMHFIILLALFSIIFGTLVSMFALHHVLNPIIELSRAMQKVAKGDYTVRLTTPVPNLKDEMYDLSSNFNQMVQELASTETLHSDFITNVSHEFKTPLAAISGYATLLQDDTLSLEERNEYIRIIIKSTKELSHMTGNILNLSRLENQTIICEKKSFRVDEQIRQIILRMEPVWSAKNLSINPELDMITWHGSQELAAHIWNNLLDNAVKFTPQGGEINITAHSDGEWMTVTFQDSGIGMTPEVQAHVFDKFYQGDVSHEKKGNGLGLSLVQKIVALHGGFIQLESYPDLGSSFKVRLPLHSDE
ncbi:MAG TPA: two-component sensor histidine kinase [Lachnospiraceae bacterium]|nr:two-component sensor histidine kinase [Lachnospiraceae bacterium]